MRLIAFVLFLLSSPAWAGVPCTLPFNLTNGTTADATQVMANYNALVTCLGTAAAAGANSDITSLNGLTTPLPHTAGGSNVYAGGVSGGTANALTLSSTTPTFILATGNIVTFIAFSPNSAATTLNVQGTGAVAVERHTQAGFTNMVGGEIKGGDLVMLQYDGSVFQCLSCGRDMIGQMMDYAGTSVPLGWLAADGSCQAQSNFPALFNVIGTGYGACGGGQFALPDGRGRVLAGFDNQGTAGNAGRMTSCGGNEIAVGGTCGLQNEAILLANLPNISFTAVVTDPGHHHAGGQASVQNQQTGTPASAIGWSNAATNTSNATTGISVSVPTGGSGTALPTVQPTAFIFKIIKL